MRRLLSGFALCLAVWFVPGDAAGSRAATYYANPDTGVSACACHDPGAFCGSPSTCGISLPYRCLADAVRRTCPGDTVIARNGTYPECFYINNSGSSDASRVEIKAEFNGQAIISRPATCSGQGETIVFAASYVTLRGFKITAAPSAPAGPGVTVTGGPSNEISQCEIYGNQGGLTFYGAGNRLIDTLVHDNTFSGITLAAPNTTITGGQSTNNGGGVSITGMADSTTITGLVVRNNQSIGIDLGTSFNTLTNVVVNDSGLYGIYVRPGANNNTVTGGEIANDALGIFVYDGTPQATDNTFTGIDIHGHTVDGIKLDGGVHTTIDRCHVHHNYLNGIAEGGLHTVIQYSEIDHNSSGQGSHGLYLGGQSGTIRGNAVHHNEAWGIHLWAAPQGTPTDHYIVENNDVYANGAGIVLGGSNFPPTDPRFCREMPQYTEVRYNLVHHNDTTGMNYLLTTCDAPTNCTGTDIGNSFHHNTVYANGGLMMQASFVKDDRLLVKNNLLVGTSASPTLVWVTNSSMFANAFDGNIAFKLGGSSSDPIFDWNSLTYSFDQIHASGIRQKTTCLAATGSDPLNPMETHLGHVRPAGSAPTSAMGTSTFGSARPASPAGSAVPEPTAGRTSTTRRRRPPARPPTTPRPAEGSAPTSTSTPI